MNVIGSVVPIRNIKLPRTRVTPADAIRPSVRLIAR